MKTLMLAFAVLAGCATDEPPPPRCYEINAPDSIACNVGGLCEWEGAECCNIPTRNSQPDPKCEGVYGE